MTIRLSRFKTPLTASLLLVASLALNGCSGLPATTSKSGPDSLTAITDTPTNIHHPGKFVWHDLLTPDAAASQNFYAELFGWTFTTRGQYIEIHNGNRKIGGIAQVSPGKKGSRPGASWLASLSVADVDAAIREVTSRHGKVINGPLDMPMRGRGALISDPHGAHLVLLYALGGDPEDREPAMGDWLWNEIWTNAPDETIAFYQAVGDYSEVRKNEDYAILINEGKWRAGIRFADGDVTIRWVPAIRVADPGALLSRVEALGGTVWVRPGELPGNPGTALISDNMGALLILQQWTFSNIEEGH